MTFKKKLIIHVMVTMLLIVYTFFGQTFSLGEAPPFSISPVSRIVKSDDGFPLVTYKLKLTPDIYKGRSPRAIIFFIQSPCDETVLDKLGILAGSVAMGSDAVMLENRGIDENGKVNLGVCYKYSSLETRIEDHVKVLNEYLKETDPNIPVILMGEKEGGLVASMIASKESRVSFLILLETGGGWTRSEEMEFLFLKNGEHLDIYSLDEFKYMFEDIKAHADSLKMWAGHSYRWWSSFLWEKSLDYLASLDIPIFLSHGGRDDTIPIESARALKGKFDELGKTNLTYREYTKAKGPYAHMKGGLLMYPLIEVDVLEWFKNHKLLTEIERKNFDRRVRVAHPEFFN